MGRIRGAVEIGLMAGIASRREVAVVVVGVALGARHCGVEAGQREIRVQGMVEDHAGGGPVGVGVA